jgi:hypothetical protein
MKTANIISPPTRLLLLATLLITAKLAMPAIADDFPPRPLPDADRQILDEYLGNGVVGDALPIPRLTHGVNDLITLGNDLDWRVLITAGKAVGQEQTGSLSLLHRPDNNSSFRIDLGDGRNVLFGQLDPQGNFWCYASQDNREGVLSRFSPPQPYFLANMTPGQTRTSTTHVEVADLSQPGVETHTGNLQIDFTYVGAYRLHVPAGDIDTVLFKSHLTGNVGPASIDDTLYHFFAKGHGIVAVVETNNVSAVLIYHEKTRTGKVLVETITKQ